MFKKSVYALCVLSSLMGMAGCNSTPVKTGPASPAELNIAPDDSFALKMLKFSNAASNSQDQTVSEEDWKKINGATPSVMAMNAASGYAGVGVLGGSGFSGGLMNVGLQWLTSKNTTPVMKFSFLQIVPVSELDQSEQMMKSFLLTSLDATKASIVSKVWGGREHRYLAYQGLPFDTPYSEGNTDYIAWSLASPVTKLSANELKNYLEIDLPAGDYYVTNTSLNYCVEGAVLDNLKTVKFSYPTFLYVPPKDKHSTEQCPNLQALRGNVQSVVDLNVMKPYYLIKPSKS